MMGVRSKEHYKIGHALVALRDGHGSSPIFAPPIHNVKNPLKPRIILNGREAL